MKKYTPYILVAIALILLGAGAYYLRLKQEGMSIAESKPGVYQNDDYNFCIRYPESYKLTTLPEGVNPPAVLSLNISASVPSTGHDPETNVGIDSMRSMLLTVSTPASPDLHSHVAALIEKQFLISETDTSINGLSAVAVNAKSAFDGSPYKATYLFLPKSGNVGDSLVTTTYADGTEYETKFDDTVLSIKKKDPGVDCN